MSDTIPQITNKYIDGQTLEVFAASLGIGATKQSVQQWKDGVWKPSIITLLKVIGSPDASPAAREWARECINALSGFEVELEPTLDAEIERRR